MALKRQTKALASGSSSSVSSHCMYQLYTMLQTKLLLSPACARCESVLLSAWPHFLVLPVACVDTYMSSSEPYLLKAHSWTAVVCASHCTSWVVHFNLGCFYCVQDPFGKGGGCSVDACVWCMSISYLLETEQCLRSVGWQLVILAYVCMWKLGHLRSFQTALWFSSSFSGNSLHVVDVKCSFFQVR